MANIVTNHIKRYPLATLLLAVIIFLSLFPFQHVRLMENVPLADKWTHMLMYGGFCLVLWTEYLWHHSQTHWGKVLCWAFLAPIAFSGLMELCQAYLTTYRSGEWLDLAANSIGVAAAAIIGPTILKWVVKRILARKG
ncbi:MAG: VanZ family protein [Bacteroidaceae bacterium]|nr:VanZ family protein [Bacteroidaceae bacterium]